MTSPCFRTPESWAKVWSTRGSAGRYNKNHAWRFKGLCQFTEIVDLQQTRTLQSRPGVLLVEAHDPEPQLQCMAGDAAAHFAESHDAYRLLGCIVHDGHHEKSSHWQRCWGALRCKGTGGWRIPFPAGLRSLAMAQPIEDYALIGDCETAALVGRNGSIDWLCWPRFDLGAVFAALLGDADNGHWVIAAAEPNARNSRSYRRNTLILETQIETSVGSAIVTDLMPLRREGTSHLVRIVRGRAGQVEMRSELVMRFDYGSIVPWVTRQGDHSLHAVAGPHSVILHSQAAFKPEKFRHHASFVVGAGQTICFTMGYSPSYNVPLEDRPHAGAR